MQSQGFPNSSNFVFEAIRETRVKQAVEHCHAPNVFGTVDMEKVSQ